MSTKQEDFIGITVSQLEKTDKNIQNTFRPQIILSTEEWERFIHIIESPFEENECLKRAFEKLEKFEARKNKIK